MRRLLALSATALLAACGGSELTPRDALFQAQAKTSKQTTVRMSMTGEATIPGAGSLEFESEGEFDTRSKRGHMTMQMEQVGEMELVMDGFVMYMRMEFLQKEAPQLKPWIQLDLKKIGEQAGVDFEALMQLGQQQDPTLTLEQLRAAGEIEEVGEQEEVRGEQTTHYRATIDLERQAELVEKKNPKAAEEIRKLATLTGESQIPMDVWVDGDELVRKMKWTQKLPEQGSMKMTMELYDFGADVNVELPPSDQTMTFEELMELSQEGSG